MEVLAVALVVLVLIGAALSASAKKHAREQAEAACRFFTAVDADGGFAAIEAPGVNLRRGELALLFGPGTLHEMRSHRYSTGQSYRVVKGFYVSQRQYKSRQSLDVVAQGALRVTNRRVLFVGGVKTATVEMKNLVSVETVGGCTHLHSAKRQKPIVIGHAEYLLVSLLVQFLTSADLAEPRLPAGLRIAASLGEEAGSLNLRFGEQPQAA